MNRFVRLFLPSLLFAIVLSIPGCNGASQVNGGTTQTPPTPQVVVTPASSSITTVQSLNVTLAVSGTSGKPTESVVLSSGSYTSLAATLNSGTATIAIPAGSLATGSDTLTGKYTPDFASTSAFNSASGTAAVTVIQSAI
jgi:hypothetical protein